MKANAGITLLELVVVTAILATVVAISLPSLDRFYASSHERESAADILALLRTARSQAANRNSERRVAFDLDSGSYWIERNEGTSNSANWQQDRCVKTFSTGLQMKTGASCQNDAAGKGDGTAAADNFIHFNPNGSCGSGGSANSRYVCVVRNGIVRFRIGVPSSTLGRAVITGEP